MARDMFGGSSDDYAVDTNGRPLPNRRIRFYTSAAMTSEITDLASDVTGTGSPLTVSTDSHGFWGPVYGPDGVTTMYAGAADGAGNPPGYVVAIYTHTVGGVASFNTRTGPVTLSKADVTGTALAAADVGAENVVVHGSVAGTARPAGATVVHWIGSVAPTNVATNDEWTDTANKILKRWNGTAFDALGSAASSATLTPTAVKTAGYTASASDLVPVDTTSGNVTITLPAAPADKSIIGVKHHIRGGTNTVTVACGGTDHFSTSNATTRAVTVLGESILAQYQSSTGLWFVTATDTPLSQLDSRYDATGAATAAQTASLQKSSNLSDIASAATARTNLGLAALATKATAAVPGDLSATGTPSATTFLRGDGAWATPAGGSATPGIAMRLATGRYTVNLPGASTGAALSNTNTGFISFSPMTFPRAVTLTTIGIEVTTAVAASAVRLGLYADSSGIPGSLVTDFGTIDSTTTGVKTITISQAVSATDYWLAAVQQGGASQVSVKQTSSFGLASDSRSTVPTGFTIASLETSTGAFSSGALPSTVTAANGASTCVRFLLGI